MWSMLSSSASARGARLKTGATTTPPLQSSLSQPIPTSHHRGEAEFRDKHVAKVRRAHDELDGASPEGRARRQSKYVRHEAVRMVPGQEELGVQSGVPKSLSEVLRSPLLRQKFREFLKQRHASESLMFYECVELFEMVTEATWRRRAAEGIVAKFIATSATFEINIGSATRRRLLATTRWEPDSFLEAKAETYDLLKTNFFAEFVAKECLRAE